MGFFGWFFFLIFASWAAFYFFGRQITRFFLQTLIRRAVKQSEQQAQQYQRNYSRDPYHDSIAFDENASVNIPRNPAPPKGPGLNEVAEDVEFEDVRE